MAAWESNLAVGNFWTLHLDVKLLVINFYCFPHKPQRMPPPAWSSWRAPSLRGEGSSTSWRGVSSSAHRPRPRDDCQHRPLLIGISEQVLSQINNVCFVKQCHLQYEIIRRVVSNFVFIIWFLTFTFLLVYHFHSCSCFQESIGWSSATAFYDLWQTQKWQ